MTSNNHGELKARLRKEILELRDGLDKAVGIEGSLAAAEHGAALDLFTSGGFAPGTIVAGFFPIRSEIDPRPLMTRLAAMGARLCLPVVVDQKTIEFRELVRGGELVSSGFGTVGPDESAATLDPDILLIPLSVFDEFGGRIGYGAGYYDRAIERLVERSIEPRLLGMAYSLQQVKKVPMEAHDRYLEGVITEAGHMVAKGRNP